LKLYVVGMVHAHFSRNAHTSERYGYEDLEGFMSLMTGDEKHSEAATSTLDVIWTIYDRILNVDPDDPTAPERDRFYLSKGHGPMAFYAVLTAKGFLNPVALEGFGSYDSPLGHHPDRSLVPGVEISSGSLGHGLALAVRAAIGLGIKRSAARIICLLGDGELDEGSNHEAIALAGRLGLSRLTAVVIDNQSSMLGWPGGIESRFEVEGWTSAVVNGRDHDSIELGITERLGQSPHVVVAHVGSRNA
jgi:transketolase